MSRKDFIILGCIILLFFGCLTWITIHPLSYKVYKRALASPSIDIRYYADSSNKVKDWGSLENLKINWQNIHEYVNDDFFIGIKDEPEIEIDLIDSMGNYLDFWQFPNETQEQLDKYGKIYGDCDCLAIYINACLQRLGYTTKLCMGYLYIDGMKNGHLWTAAKINGEWCIVESVTTKLTIIPYSERELIKNNTGVWYQELLNFDSKLITKDYIFSSVDACELPKSVVNELDNKL